ncbi:MAG: glycerophosphodiester phosphodiesterase family protein, partial [Verrucomicrobiota bacterium]
MNSPADARSGPTGRALAGFLAVQLLLALLLFRDALWGKPLLAPLDIAPALLSEFKAVDPSRAVPDNHYILDQLVYDLPLQRTIHAAVRRGEVPWWDPYTYGGRPLLADAHVNGTDPVRWLCYAVLPFGPAYNWTRILHFVVAGTGMFLLLRRLGIGSPLPFWLALAWEFAGCQVVKFGHPWVPASFAWYPWLWLAFHHAWETGSRRAIAGIALATAAVFYAGNLQSHTYLPLFVGALVVGYGGGRPAGWAKALRPLAPGILLGTCLAAPMLAAEIEFFQQNVRHTDVGVPTKPWLAAALSLGVSTLELDTAITKDGIVVVSHDARLNPNITRGPDGRWLNPPTRAVREMSLDELGHYDVGRIKPGSEYSYSFPDQKRIDGVRMPTLSHVFQLARRAGNGDVHFNIEIKTSPQKPGDTMAPEAFARALLALIESEGMSARVTIQSFDWRALKSAQALAPKIPTSYLSVQQRLLDNIAAGRPEGSAWTAGIQ